MADTVGMSVLLDDTGEKPRALQHWADLGIIQAEADTDKRGRGRYREFKAAPYWGERKWALVASALAQLRIPMGDVRKITDWLRRYGSPDAGGYVYPDDDTDPPEHMKEHRFKGGFFYRALTTDEDVILLLNLNNTDPASLGVYMHFTPPIRDEMFNPPAGVKVVHPTPGFVLQNLVSFSTKFNRGYYLNLTSVFAPLRG